jgi:hypothetical protein
MPRISDVPKLISGAAQEFWVDIQKSERPPLPVITLIYESGTRIVMVTEGAATLEDAVRVSHDTARKMSQKAAVCIEVWDGYATTDGKKADAILINWWVEGRGPFFQFQRYRRDPFELIREGGGGTAEAGPSA